MEEAVETVSKLSSGMPIGDNQTIALLNEACGADVSFLPATLDDLATKLTSVQGNLNAFVNLASCHQVSPLVRRVTHGALCNESAYGLVWIWACSFTICVLNFVLLTTRAALFNSIKAKKPRPHKPKRVVEKEFQEYKDFMSPYYEDAHEWKMQSKMKKAVEIDFGSQILQNPTFETHATTKPSFDNCSEGADMNRSEDDGDDESSYGSSYESFDEDDSQASEESDDDSQSAMLSFMTETKSIAMHALDTVKKLKPLLGNFGKRDNDNDNDGDEDSVLEESLFLEEDSVPEESLFLEDSSVRRARSPSLDSDGGDGVWNMMITPPNRNMPLFSGFRVLSVLTPTAPQKAFSRLSRTKAADVDPSELDPLTTPPKTQPSITNNSGDDDDVRPRHLKLSPFFLPGESQPRTPQQSSLRIHSDEDSEDGMPIYYEDGVPKRPKKAYRRYGRTRASHGEDYKR